MTGAAPALGMGARVSNPAPARQPLELAFFTRSVHEVARGLIGCTLEVGECAGVIVETEAYDEDDPACHAYGGRTPRNEPLFGSPGIAYVYLSYGIHRLMNVVAEPQGRAAAALIRALEPVAGIEAMRRRRGRMRLEDLCSGPGKLSQALGIGLELNGAAVTAPPFSILAPPADAQPREVCASTRIGISKAVDLRWRYSVEGSRFVSRPRPSRPAGLPARGLPPGVGVGPSQI